MSVGLRWVRVVADNLAGPDGPLAYWSVQGVCGVHAVFTTRCGGVSCGRYRGLNLGLGTGDDAERVQSNRRILMSALGDGSPRRVQLVRQVHSSRVIRVAQALGEHVGSGWMIGPEADGMLTEGPGLALSMLYADCLPVYIVDPGRRVVGLAHAGWRGLVSGIVEKTLSTMRSGWGSEPAECVVFLGPCIEREAFEVDRPVLRALSRWAPWWRQVTYPSRPGRAKMDLAAAARTRLIECGVERLLGPPAGTFHSDDLYSYRRDGGITGRSAALLWLEPCPPEGTRACGIEGL